jgi:hypothetical protein
LIDPAKAGAALAIIHPNQPDIAARELVSLARQEVRAHDLSTEEYRAACEAYVAAGLAVYQAAVVSVGEEPATAPKPWPSVKTEPKQYVSPFTLVDSQAGVSEQ